MILDDLSTSNRPASGLAQACLAELLGTFMFVAVGGMAACVADMQAEPGDIRVAWANGLILAVMVSATMNISGGHLNPAVTVALLAGARIGRRRAVAYVIAQVIGASPAGLMLGWIMTSGVARDDLGDVLAFAGREGALGTPSFSPKVISAFTATGIEALLTFVLVFVVYATMVDPRRVRMGGLGAGMTFAALMMAAEPLTGAAMNPARVLGHLIGGGQMTLDLWSQQWVYWTGPLAGGLLAAGVYESVILPHREQ